MRQKLKGLVAQAMSGAKDYRGITYDVVGYALQTANAPGGATINGAITAPRPCLAMIYVYGNGATGFTNGTGGGGGGATFRRVRLGQGQTITFTIPPATAQGVNSSTDGADVTLTLPSGQQMVAGGGKSGSNGGAGGMGSGGEINRRGGQAGTAGIPGNAGEFGGAGGAADVGFSRGGAGGGAGFSDHGQDLTGGAGSAGDSGGNLPGGTPGGGSGAYSGGNQPGIGGAGRVVVLMLRAR